MEDQYTESSSYSSKRYATCSASQRESQNGKIARTSERYADQSKTNQTTNKKPGYSHTLYRRIAFQQAQQQAAEYLITNRESITSDILLTEDSTAPINANRRLCRLTSARVVKARRESKHHWSPSLDFLH